MSNHDFSTADFLVGIRDSIVEIREDITYTLFFGIRSTFQCIKILKTSLFENKRTVLLSDGIAHIDEDHLEITPIYFDAAADVADLIADPTCRFARILRHMFSFGVIYMKRSSSLLEFHKDPVIDFVVNFCRQTPLICLDDYIVVDDENSRAMALSFRQLRTSLFIDARRSSSKSNDRIHKLAPFSDPGMSEGSFAIQNRLSDRPSNIRITNHDASSPSILSRRSSAHFYNASQSETKLAYPTIKEHADGDANDGFPDSPPTTSTCDIRCCFEPFVGSGKSQSRR